ncbi:MAG: hypothetical protein JWQ71_3710 [Pedosphaera sp.]|nr:hypothetical protein [Pedosphaera sp.]
MKTISIMIMARFVLLFGPMINYFNISLKSVVALSALLFSLSAIALPNLTPYQPAGSSDKIVVSTVTGTTTDNSPLTTADTLYVDWTVANNGDVAAGPFTTALYVDNVFTASANHSSGLGSGFISRVTDYQLGSLSAGTHTLQIITDAGGTVAESNEADNTYTKTITVTVPNLPNLVPYQPAGWADKIVISKVTGTSTDGASLTTADTLYVDWAVINSGNVAAGASTTSLYVDNVLKNSWPSPSLAVSSYDSFQDYSIGSLPAGSHTIKITADSGAAVAESNEADNTYTRTISVAPATLSAPTLTAPANGATGLSTTPSFTWSAISGATGYRIMVASSAADLPTSASASTGGASLVINATSATTSYTPTLPINPGTTYYWQVHGLTGSDNGTWSSVNSFSTIAGATGGLTIVPTFGSSITSDPQSAAIQSTINSAIAVYASKFSNPITVFITFEKVSIGLGSSSSYLQARPYSSYRAALVSHATTADDTAALAHLPGGSSNPVTGDPSINVNLPLARALGFSTPAVPQDGTISLNTSLMNLSGAETDANKYALFSVVCHEIDEVLGFGSALNNLSNGAPAPTGPVSPNDLFRYDQNGARSLTTDANAIAFFSLDGTTQLARFNQTQGRDFQDWYSPGGQTPQVQDATGTLGATPVLGVELRMLDVIGYTPVVAQAAITASAGSGGTISPTGSFNKNLGDSQVFTATANSGFFINQWLLDGSVVQTGGTTYTLSNIQANHTVQVTFTAKSNQTITFGALASKVYGDPSFSVSATASSGLPVSFSILSGPATISSGTNISITATGTVVVRASQGGSATYNAAPNVDQSFTVSKANQTITFGTLTNKVYGDASFSVSASAGSGLPVTFIIFSGPATISGNNVTITGAGTVVVRASQAGNANYNAAPNVDQSFTVAKANQAITFNPLPSRAQGEPAFTVAASTTSGLTATYSIFSGPATIAGSTITVTNTGTVVVRAAQAGNANYNTAPNVDQSFTVYPAPTITLTQSGQNVILSWPTNVAGFTLLSATNLTPAVTWASVLPSPVIVSGQYTVTNATANNAKFYRLQK